MARRIIDALIANGTVPLEDRELYEYGIRQGGLMVINLLTTILVGMSLGMVLESIVFLLAYVPMRTYAGGYHANTQLMCYLLSIPFMFIVLILIRMIPWNGYICLGALLCIGLVLYKLAPVENINRPFRKIEIEVFRKRTRIIAVVLTCISISLLLAGVTQISASIIMALLMTAVMLILGVFKNNRVKVK